MMEFVIAAAIFGFAAVFAVPWVSAFLGGFIPANYKGYLPSATAPALTMSSAINAVIFGVVLAGILILLHKFGLRAHTKGIEA